MVKGSTVAVGIGAAALLGIGAYYLISQVKRGGAGKFTLITDAGPGGTISPLSPSGISEPVGKVVNVTIIAASGYTIGQVLQNGSPINTSTTDTTATYQITMNMDQIINVTFYQGGQPPVSTPVAIQALNTQAIVWGYYGCKIALSPGTRTPGIISNVSIHPCDQNWTWDNYAQTQIQFKVIDANGNGVPDIVTNGKHSLSVQISRTYVYYDNSKYQGYLIINGQMDNSIILYPDANGIITINLSYFCVPASLNQPYKMPYDAGLYVNIINIAANIQGIFNYHPYDGWNGKIDGLPSTFVGKGGHGITGVGPAAMGGAVQNILSAQIIGTSIAAAQTICSCGFNIKML